MAISKTIVLIIHFYRLPKRVIQKPKESQINMLVEFMEKHPEFARNECSTTEADNLWDEIVYELNLADGFSKNARALKR